MTKIEWTEVTWNPIVGCSLASPGCTNCYAMRFAGTRLGHVRKYDGLTQPAKLGPVWTGELAFDEKALLAPLGWKRPRMVFVNSMGDLFHDRIPDEWIDRVFAVMALCPQHTFQVLTKRSARMRAYFRESTRWRWRIAELLNDLKPSPLWNGNVYRGWQHLHGRPNGLPNVWLGVSVEDQQRADERIPDLLETPAELRWISAEPLLGPVSIIDAIWAAPKFDNIWARIDWVVAGGESGPGARPMHPDWARSLRDQCAAADVPFFFKQWGQWVPIGWEHADSKHLITADGFVVPKALAVMKRKQYGHGLIEVAKLGKKRAGRLLDGIEHNGMPEAINA